MQEKTLHVSRFIALGKVGNASKLKWIYAFNIAPMAKMPVLKLNEQPANTTPCPYGITQEEDETEARKAINVFNHINLSIEFTLIIRTGSIR